MSRKLKNILMIAAIVLLCGALAFTVVKAKSSGQTAPGQMAQSGQEMGTMPEGNQQDGTTAPENTNSQDGETPPSIPEGEGEQSGETAPTKPEGENSETPPEKPDGENNDSGSTAPDQQNAGQDGTQSAQDGQTPPSMPSENGENSDGTVPEMPSGQQGADQNMTAGSTLQVGYYIAFGAEGLLIAALVMYLILSKMNEKTFKETFAVRKNLIIAIVAVLLMTGGVTWGAGALTQQLMTSQSPASTETNSQTTASNASDTATAVKTVDGSSETLTETYESTESDVSAILVKNGGTAAITGATITKSGGDSSNTENSEFYGINAALLVTQNSSAVIKNATITTAAKGANAVFATGENAKITISDSTITSTASSSARGLDATYGGTIEAENVTITTQGGSCAALATDRGEGTVTAKKSNLTTNGAGSPVIYSTGNISVEDTTGVANGAQIAVIEGKNTATVTSSKMTCSAAGNRGDVDIAGVMIYQSMSGDAGEGTGTFTAKDSELSIASTSQYYQSAPMFFVTNTDAVINLENTTLNFGSSVLLSAKGTDEWGNSGSNGGNVTLNATDQTLKGHIVLDSLSELTMVMNASTYEGVINGDQSAKSVKLTLDKNSKIKLTGDSYVTELDNADTSNSNIDFNGYTLYVNGQAING